MHGAHACRDNILTGENHFPPCTTAFNVVQANILELNKKIWLSGNGCKRILCTKRNSSAAKTTMHMMFAFGARARGEHGWRG